MTEDDDREIYKWSWENLDTKGRIKILLIAFVPIVVVMAIGLIFEDEILYPHEFTKNEMYMADILEHQLEIGNVDFSCDIDFLSQYHDDTICISELDVITPTKLGYILHGNTKSGHMWLDSNGEIVKIRGTNDKSEIEYNGTVNKIKVNGKGYYLITNAVMQGNHNG